MHRLRSLIILCFFANQLTQTLRAHSYSTHKKRKKEAHLDNTKRQEIETMPHNVYFFKQKSELRHPGIKRFDCPERLIAKAPKQDLKAHLTASLLPLIPNIYSKDIRKISPEEEAVLIEAIQEIFPDCPLDELFEKLQTCASSQSKKPLYHSSDLAKEAPLFAGTYHSLLNNINLIRENVKGMLKSKAKQRNFLLLRPPGHHACSALGGFCYINNIVLAQRLILTFNPEATIAIIDLDLHDGNGTRDLLSRNHRNTFMLNLFNGLVYPYHPKNPFIEIDSCSYVINKALPIGTKHRTYRIKLSTGLKELATKFGPNGPDYVLINAGFDTSLVDSITRFRKQGFTFEPRDYESYYHLINQAFPESYITAFLEGGYDPKTLQESLIFAMKGLFSH